MDLQELAMRLNNLERARDADLQAQAQQAFMNKYGARIGNNQGLGMVILNELNRRGIDTSAADEAVQSILDQLRMEATALLDTIKVDMSQANQLMDKIDAIDQSVNAAALATGQDQGLPTQDMEPPIPEGVTPPASPEAMAGGFPDGDMPEGFVPEQATEEQVPEQPVPEEQVPEQPAPEEQVSDANKKNILKNLSKYKHVVSDIRKKRIQQPNGNKIDGGILAACQGGF